MVLDRSEICCYASSLILNSGRTKVDGPQNRQKIGPRFDGILRMKGKRWELGVIEVAKAYTGDTSTKWIRDSDKLDAALKNMLFRLHDDFEGYDDVLKLQTVGFQCAGYNAKLVRCWAREAHGEVFYDRSDTLEIVLEHSRLDRLWNVMKYAHAFKRISDDVCRVMQEGPMKTAEERRKAFLQY